MKEYIKKLYKVRVLNPLKNFELEEQEIERRFDPLTGFSTIVAKGRLQYVKRFFEKDDRLLKKLAEASKATCPFCPERIEVSTPKFSPEIVAEGRVKVGRCYAFPSLHAHSELSLVVVMGPSHYLGLDELEESLFYEALKAGLEALTKVFEKQPTVSYASLIMNYLPTSGSSVLHPHIQVLASNIPFNNLRLLLAKSLNYYLTNGSNYWEELVEYERGLDERFIGEKGATAWLVPFAPSRFFEVWGIIKGKSDLTMLKDVDLQDVSKGIVGILRSYHEMGISSLNLATYSSPLGEPCGYFNVMVRLCARFGLKEPFISDFWALPTLLMESEIVESPEEYVRLIKMHSM